MATSSMAFHQAPSKLEVFRQVYQSLKPGGVFVFSDHISGQNPAFDRLIGWERARVKLGHGTSPAEVEQFIQNNQDA